MVNENGRLMMRGSCGGSRGSCGDCGDCGDRGAVAGIAGMAGIARDQGRSPDIFVENGCHHFPRGVALISFCFMICKQWRGMAGGLQGGACGAVAGA